MEMWGTAFEQNGKDWAIANPVGTGPFKFEQWEKSVAITYTRNPDYWQEGLPYLDRFEWALIGDENTAKNSLLTEEINVFILQTATFIDELTPYNLDPNSPIELIAPKAQFGFMSSGIMPDSKNPNSPFSDVRVRKAIGYAIDEEAIATSLYRGAVVPLDQWAVKGTWTHNAQIDPFPYNPEKAKQLLAEAGYADGFKTNIAVLAHQGPLATAYQAFLKEIGIDLSIQVVDYGQYTAMQNGGWDGLVVWTFPMHTDLPTVMGRHMGANASIFGINTTPVPELHQLIEDAKKVTTMEERQRFAHEMQKVAFEDNAIAIPIFMLHYPYAKQKYVRDDGFFATYGQDFTPHLMWLDK